MTDQVQPDQPDEAVEVLRAVWAAEGTSSADLDDDCGPTKACKNMKDVSFDGLAEPGSDLGEAWRSKLRARGQAQHAGGSIRDLVLGTDRAPLTDVQHAGGEGALHGPSRRPSAQLTEILRGGGYLADRGPGDRAVRRPLAEPADPARGRGGRRQDRGGQGPGHRVRPQADPAAVLRGHRHQPGAVRVGLRPPDAADPRAVRARSSTTTTRSTSCSGRSSCSSGRCSRRCGPATRRCCSIDEVDRADDEFEAFLLEVLRTSRSRIPEIGTIAAETPPLVVLTSNRTRELHDALKRRCLYHWVGYPSAERELEIVLVREPGVSETLARKVVAAVNRLRELDLAKPPGVAETIDWVRTLGRARRDRAGRPHRRRTRWAPSSRSATTSSWSAST